MSSFALLAASMLSTHSGGKNDRPAVAQTKSSSRMQQATQRKAFGDITNKQQQHQSGSGAMAAPVKRQPTSVKPLAPAAFFAAVPAAAAAAAVPLLQRTPAQLLEDLSWLTADLAKS